MTLKSHELKTFMAKMLYDLSIRKLRPNDLDMLSAETSVRFMSPNGRWSFPLSTCTQGWCRLWRTTSRWWRNRQVTCCKRGAWTNSQGRWRRRCCAVQHSSSAEWSCCSIHSTSAYQWSAPETEMEKKQIQSFELSWTWFGNEFLKKPEWEQAQRNQFQIKTIIKSMQ